MLKDLASYLAIPYQWDGRDFSGCDCWGLVIFYLKNKFGITLVDYQHGYRNSKEMVGTQIMIEKAYEDFLKVDNPQAGDIAVLRNGSRTPNHCGVMIDKDTMLHTYEGVGCHTSKLKEWEDRLWGIYRHKDLTNENYIYSERFGKRGTP